MNAWQYVVQCHTSLETQQLAEAAPSPQLDLALSWTHASRCVSLHLHVCVGAIVTLAYVYVHGVCLHCTVLLHVYVHVCEVTNVGACLSACAYVIVFA